MSAYDAVDGSRRRHLGAIEWLLLKPTLKGGAAQMNVTTIGVDLAKSVFPVHGVPALDVAA